MIRHLVALISVVAPCPAALAIVVPGVFPPRIFETFDDYPDGYELRLDYPTVSPASIFGATVTSSDGLYPGIQGKAAEFDIALTTAPVVLRIRNDELAILTPDLFGPLVFRADIYDDGITEGKRITVDVRSQPAGGGAQNVIRMGSPFPFFPFGYMQAGVADNPAVGWQPFSLPDDLNERAEIGPGWHRFAVHITMTELIYSLDLHRDGVVDAIDVVPAILHPIGFNEMRFGKMLPSFEPAFIAVDNLVLMAVPEPATLVTAVIAGLTIIRARRRGDVCTSCE